MLRTDAKTSYGKRVAIPAKLGRIASCLRVGFAFGAAHVQFLRCEVCLPSKDDLRLLGSHCNGPVCPVDARFGKAKSFVSSELNHPISDFGFPLSNGFQKKNAL